MTPMAAKRNVLVLLAIAGAGVALASFRGGERTVGPATLVATGALAVVLTLIAEVAPQLATGLAAVMALTIWLAGGEATQALGQATRTVRRAAGETVRVNRPGGRAP